MKVSDIISAIEEFAPLRIQEKWDNSGLLIGTPEDEVHGVLVGFDCTPELIDEAVSVGADMVVTHHPLIFRGLKRIRKDDPVGLAVIKAVSAGVAVYAAHTTADKVMEGVSGAMARKLGLKNVEILVPEDGDTGLGVIGDLPSPMSAEEAVAFVKKAFSLKVARVSRPIDGKISRIAMCGGSGADMISDALAAGAQMYLSGDISYHNFFTPDGLMIMNIGHFESEIDITGILFSVIRKKFPNFAVRVSERMENPVRYC